MKTCLLLLASILATTAAIADTDSTLKAAQGLARADTPEAANAHARVLGHHPAVLVSKNWDSRGIDPSTIALSHPALLPREKPQHAIAANERVPGNRSSGQ